VKQSFEFTTEDIQDTKGIRQFLAQVIVADGLGGGFHPETQFADYATDDGQESVYTEEQADALDMVMEEIVDSISMEAVCVIVEQIDLATGLLVADIRP
jgi:hypothetical protein